LASGRGAARVEWPSACRIDAFAWDGQTEAGEQVFFDVTLTHFGRSRTDACSVAGKYFQ
jgi:hypothetical protein